MLFFNLNTNDGNYIIMKLPFEAYTVKNISQKSSKSFIPKGSKIKIKNIFRNSQGIFCETYYKGVCTTLNSKDISIDKK